MTAPDGRSAVEQAGAWVVDYLTAHGGTARAGDVLAAAAVAGHNGKACRRACAGVGITMTRAGFGKGSTWALPSVPNAVPNAGRAVPNDTRSGQAEVSPANTDTDVPDEAEPTPPKTWRVPTTTDIYGRPGGYVQVSSPEAAASWDSRQWERLS